MSPERKYDVENFINKLTAWRSSFYTYFENSVENAYTRKLIDGVRVRAAFDPIKAISDEDKKAKQRYLENTLLQSQKKERNDIYNNYANLIKELAYYGDKDNWEELVLNEEKRIAKDTLKKLKELYKLQAKESKKNRVPTVNFEYEINHFKRNYNSSFEEGYSFEVSHSARVTIITTYAVVIIGGMIFLSYTGFPSDLVQLFVTGLKLIVLIFLLEFLMRKFFSLKVNIKINYSNISFRWSGLLRKTPISIPWTSINLYSEEEKKGEYIFKLHSENKVVLLLKIPKSRDIGLSSRRIHEYEKFLSKLNSYDLPPPAKHIKGKKFRYLSLWDKWVVGKDAEINET
jgi:hypothetical protein